jgi:hypothetical protein
MNVLVALALRLAPILLRFLWYVVLVPPLIATPYLIPGIVKQSFLVAQFASTVAQEIIWTHGMVLLALVVIAI